MARMHPSRRVETAIFLSTVLFATPSAAAKDDGDDFSNDLFSDLAPILALSGEQVAKRFMSQSTCWADNIIFAMAPLGVITAVVGAIRVGGPAWLKAIIGRARESQATVEVELMSSTSPNVCELWNGQGIVRILGSLPILEILWFPHRRDSKPDYGLFTLDAAIRDCLVEPEGMLKIPAIRKSANASSARELSRKFESQDKGCHAK
jgi:hypothetical protein